MSFYVDLSKISISEYVSILKETDLTASRQILWENIEVEFEKIQNQEVKTVKELQNKIKTAAKRKKFADESGIDENYLVILSREINSNTPPAVKLKDFPEVSEKLVSKLENCGVKNAQQMYELLEKDSAEVIAEKCTVSVSEVEKLAQLVDLSRVRWVNHTFAFMLFLTGYKCVKDVASANPEKMYEQISVINNERGFYKGKIGKQDFITCVNAAKFLHERENL